MSKAIEVIDKNGNRVVRANGILADGDRTRVPVTLMDHSIPRDPRLTAAIAEANAAKRMEAFDARHHRPRSGDTSATTEATLAKRDQRLQDAWRSPAAVYDAAKPIKPDLPAPGPNGPTHDQLIAARDRRISEAWRA